LGTEDLFFAPPTERVHDRGGVFGGQIGAQYQFANNFVVGVEFSGLDSWMKGQLACPNPGFQCHDDVKDVLEVVGRLGYSWGNVLTYIRGGFANSRNHFFNLPPTAFPVNSVSQQHDGFVVGAGFDYALGNNFVIGLEFSHVGLNKKTYTSGGATFNIEPEANIIAARLSYLFGTGGWGRY
jgi:outer membrane immunogenic protein